MLKDQLNNDQYPFFK